ncbi:MAG: glycosyltransferase family 2 protein [Bacteroidetes bacterium]|nr:glycosyltransferase family 2 protein [Bacteroidota bacterium]
MKISACTIARNAVKFDYPIVESITSILPLCDEFVVNVGFCDDGTLERIQNIASPKIKIIQSQWDDSLREGGKLLALESNRALDAVSPDSTWVFYLQADEVVHEKYIDTIRNAMETHQNNLMVDGLLFHYTHFYGNYHYVANSRRWYRNEIRVIRNNSQIRSYKDAQGFRIRDKKLQVKPIDAQIYHYGWVKSPQAQQEKQKNFHKLWHSDEQVKKMVSQANEYDYNTIDSLQLFDGTHPKTMLPRIAHQNWDFVFDTNKINMTIKEKMLAQIEKYTGWRVGENKNFKII